MFGRATIRLGIGPHSSLHLSYLQAKKMFGVHVENSIAAYAVQTLIVLNNECSAV